ncbi:MAG: NAD(P)-dependent oxidoreductase [Paracoccaceae bacterium]
MTRKVTFLGTGLMGAPMARNLLAAGIPVTVWNRSPAKADALKEDGAIVAASLGEAVAEADIVISILSDGPATQSVQADPALRQSLQSGCVWVEMASIKPDEARAQAADLAALGVLHIDAPVSGGTRGAEAGTLAIMAGGEAAVFEKVKPVLAAMGRPILVGPSGAGQLAKLANQAIVAVTIGAVAEATLLLEQGGADPDAVRDALRGGFADSTILQQHGARMSSRDFVPGGPSRLQVKDLDNALQEAVSVGLSLPTTQSIRDRFQRFCTEMDGGDMDHSGLYLELRDRNGLKEN